MENIDEQSENVVQHPMENPSEEGGGVRGESSFLKNDSSETREEGELSSYDDGVCKNPSRLPLFLMYRY